MTDIPSHSGNAPLVSVIMTTYNGENLVQQSIGAILSQTLQDIELIVIDDGSSDNTVEVIEQFDDPRIRLEINQQNMGISRSRNRALALASGRYVACSDQDDVSEPQRLARQVDFLEQHPEVILVSSAVQLTNGHATWADPIPTYSDPGVLHLSLFFGHHNITYSSVCARLSRLREHRLEFRQEYHYAEDFEYYHRVAAVGPVVTLPDILVTSKIHEGNTSLLRVEEMSANGKRFLARAYDELLGSPPDPHDIDVVWHLLVEKAVPPKRAELERAGLLIAAVLAAFTERHSSSRTDKAKAGQFASRIWWRTVAAAASTLGPGALKAYRSQPSLTAYQPKTREKLYAAAKSALPERLRQKIKSLLRGGGRFHK